MDLFGQKVDLFGSFLGKKWTFGQKGPLFAQKGPLFAQKGTKKVHFLTKKVYKTSPEKHSLKNFAPAALIIWKTNKFGRSVAKKNCQFLTFMWRVRVL